MKPMMSVGSQRLDASTWSGPTFSPLGAVRSTVAMQMASRYTGNAQITSMSRESSESVSPE